MALQPPMWSRILVGTWRAVFGRCILCHMINGSCRHLSSESGISLLCIPEAEWYFKMFLYLWMSFPSVVWRRCRKWLCFCRNVGKLSVSYAAYFRKPKSYIKYKPRNLKEKNCNNVSWDKIIIISIKKLDHSLSKLWTRVLHGNRGKVLSFSWGTGWYFGK
jgi:hypothetical protein